MWTDSWLNVSLSVGLLTFLASPLGCEEVQPQQEEQAQTASMQKQQADPVFLARAMATTTATVGVFEWRFFAGRDGLQLVGANTAGKTVKTLSTVFRRDNQGNITDVATHLSNDTNFPSFPMNGRSDVQPLDPTSQAFMRRVVLDLGRLQAGLVQDQVLADPSLAGPFACSETLIKELAGPIAGLGNPNLVPQLRALDADANRFCGSAPSTTLGEPSVDTFVTTRCAANTRCAAQFAALDGEDRGGPGTWNPAFLGTRDGFIVASSSGTTTAPQSLAITPELEPSND